MFSLIAAHSQTHLSKQSEVYPDDWVPMKSIKAKFIASTKVQVEQLVSNSHPYLKLEA